MPIVYLGDSSVVKYRGSHPSYQSCHAALAKMQLKVPNGSENEVAVVAFCGTDLKYVQ